MAASRTSTTYPRVSTSANTSSEESPPRSTSGYGPASSPDTLVTHIRHSTPCPGCAHKRDSFPRSIDFQEEVGWTEMVSEGPWCGRRRGRGARDRLATVDVVAGDYDVEPVCQGVVVEDRADVTPWRDRDHADPFAPRGSRLSGSSRSQRRASTS